MDVKRYTPRAIGCRGIPLGKQGETNAVRVEFLCAEWLNEYPAARIELHVTIPDGTAYTAKLEESGSTRAWNVTEPYTALSGAGTIELILRDAATSTVIKSVTGRTHVEKSPSADGQPAIPPNENGLNGYVRYDRAQELTAEERKRARGNIGADGAGGVGGYYKPSVDAEGNLTWEKSAESMPDAEGANIRGPEGKEGKTGATGPQGPRGTPGYTPYIGENGNWWINGVDTGTPATPQGGGGGTVTGIQIGTDTYEPDESGMVTLPEQEGGSGVPDGGTAGQMLIKQSDADGDAIWKTPTAEDVGALPTNGTAADAAKLGGVAADEYALKSEIPEDAGGDADTLGGVPASDYALKTDLSAKTDASILANGEQSMGSYAYVTIRSLKDSVHLRAILMTEDCVYAMLIEKTGTPDVTKIGGTTYENSSVTGGAKFKLGSYKRFKLLCISGEYDLVYSS